MTGACLALVAPVSAAGRAVVVIEPAGGGYAAVAARVLGSPAHQVVRPNAGELRAALGEVERAAASAASPPMAGPIARVARVLEAGGFDVARAAQADTIVVVSAAPVPIDLVEAGGTPLGLKVAISHVVAPSAATLRARLENALRARRVPLSRMAVLGVTTMPAGVRRADHDVVKAALGVADSVAVDLLVEPRAADTLRYFGRTDVQILHLDTHGDPRRVQLDARQATLSGVEAFPHVIGPSLVLLVGCATGADAESLGPALVGRGAAAAVGMAFTFRSGDPSGGDITNPVFYDAFWREIVAGAPVGRALLRAKQVLPPTAWSAIWLLFGAADLSFEVRAR